MHYISVKQEHGVPGPGQLTEAKRHDIADRIVKQKKIVEIIDLCDSDSDSTDDNAASSSSVVPPDSTSDPKVRLTDRPESNAITSNATGPKVHVLQSRPCGRGQRIVTRCGARTSTKSTLLPGNVMPKPVEAVSATATAPATDVPPLFRSYWRKRLDAPGGSESGPTPTHHTTTTNPSTSATSPSITGITEPSKSKIKKRAPKPKPDHPHKYRGPELTVLSLRAIWDHLDQAWKQASCTVKTIKRLQSWWNTNVVTSTHGLDKHQVYLLLFAQCQWWQALEEQWNKFDALPDKDRKVIMKMREVRLRKESYAVKAEAALVNEDIIKNLDAVYILVVGVKNRKLDQEDDEGKGVGEKRKRVEPGDVEVQKDDKGIQAKRVRFGGGEAVHKKALEGNRKGGAEEEEVDDGLSSDSDEEED